MDLPSTSGSAFSYYNVVGKNKIAISKIYYKTKTANWRFYGYYGGLNTVGNLGTYGQYADDSTFQVIPAWQNKGLIKFVADRLIKELEEQKIPFTYGYPNDNAYDLHIKLLGYEDVSKQRLFRKEIQKNGDN